MNLKLLSLLLCLPLLSLFAQNDDNAKLQITGSARIIVKPDIGILNIGVKDLKLKMNDAISSLGEKSKYYLDVLKKIGFTEKEIKTTKFSVSTNSVYRQNNYVDSGYIASQEIRIEFQYAPDILSKILNTLSNSDKNANFSFDFKLSEDLKEKVQAEIIDQAIIDAKNKAKAIAISSDLKLIKILRISYGGWGGNSGMNKIEREERYMASIAGNSGTIFNFTPDDLVFRDDINIDWEIEERK